MHMIHTRICCSRSRSRPFDMPVGHIEGMCLALLRIALHCPQLRSCLDCSHSVPLGCKVVAHTGQLFRHLPQPRGHSRVV